LILDFIVMPGPSHVYILTNKRVSGLVKIGRSNDPHRRVVEVNAHAGVGGRWEIAGHVQAADMDALESAVHRHLSTKRDRQSGGTEMFECTADEAGAAIMRCARQFGIEILRDELPATVRDKVKLERFQQTQRENENEQKRRRDEIARQNQVRAENENWLRYFSENAGKLTIEVDRVEKEKASASRITRDYRFLCRISLFIAVFLNGETH
jgi:hypothetical protein